MTELSQVNAPIYEALRKFRRMRVVPFDVPGHKRGRGNMELTEFLGEDCMNVDVNSMKPLDNLCHPTSVIYEAEELAADVFAKLIANKPRYSGKSSFKTWLFAIARHTAIDHLKKRSRLFCEPTETMYDLSDSSDLEKQYLSEERKIQLHHALENLNPDYSQVIYLSYFEGFSNAETAAIMKKSKRQIEKLLYNAKQSLKKILEKEGFEYEEL